MVNSFRPNYSYYLSGQIIYLAALQPELKVQLTELLTTFSKRLRVVPQGSERPGSRASRTQTNPFSESKSQEAKETQSHRRLGA